MTDQYLMGRGPATMNVTPDKLNEYLADGWKVLKAPEENKHVVVVQEVPKEPESSGEPATAVSAEEAVEKIGKRGRGKRG